MTDNTMICSNGIVIEHATAAMDKKEYGLNKYKNRFSMGSNGVESWWSEGMRRCHEDDAIKEISSFEILIYLIHLLHQFHFHFLVLMIPMEFKS